MASARVLVVDDEKMILDLVSHMVRGGGYEVLAAGSPRQALEIVRTDSPIDLVVSDVVMPEMQGPELVSEIARISPRTAGVLMSGYLIDPEELPAGIALLQKPFSAHDLMAAVEAGLARSGGDGAGGNPPKQTSSRARL